jgi:transcriptional regulator with XRE-family HTH domain
MTTTNQGEVAAEVRAARARRQRTQADVASRIGMRQDTYSRKERGITPFTVAELMAIAEDLAVPVASLLPDTSPRAVA